MTNILKNKYLILLTGALFFCTSPALADVSIQTPVDNFNPNYIIGDQEVFDYGSMSQSDIQAFLENKGSYLAAYKATSTDGTLMTAAQIIYDRAQPRMETDPLDGPYYYKGMNPKYMLVLLQKESSLIESQAIPSQTRLDFAVGYGCPDNSACSPRWQGFWKQVNSAYLQFRYYVDNPSQYNYQMGATYYVGSKYDKLYTPADYQARITTGDETSTPLYIVTPQNQATAALYDYTPHIYNGNYNFYAIWQRYFSHNTFFPNGSLLQADGEPGVWLLQNGMKRPFTSKGALTSRYDVNKIIKISRSDLDRYPKGDPIKFAQYSVVRSPNGSIYLLVDDQKRLFASSAVFKKIGINPDEIVGASWEDINIYKNGSSITATSTYPTGTLAQNNKTGGVYWVIDGTKSPILDAIFLKTKFKNRAIVKFTPQELDTYQTISPVMFDDGELLKSSLSSSVYVIADGKKNPITSGKVFESLGYKWENIITVSPKVLYQYAEGTAIDQIIAQNQLAISQSTNAKSAASTVKTSSNPATSTASSTINKIQ